MPILTIPNFPSLPITSFKSPALSQSGNRPRLTWIKYGRDVQLYLKPKYDLFHKWDQEAGIQATLARYGNFSEATNFCYDPTYPIRFDQKPRWGLGFQFNYYFTTLPTKLAFYTKPKTTIGGVWKEESGITGRLYTSPDLIVTANLAYVLNWHYSLGQKPQWLALVNFQVPLGR